MISRSLLFVPADRPERIGKALATLADIVIIDLEDAVSAGAKESARAALRESFQRLNCEERARVAIRINAASTASRHDDLSLVAELVPKGLRNIVCPKVERPGDVPTIHGTNVFPLIESVSGLAAIDLIARTGAVSRLVFGHLDFQLDAGMQCDADERELDAVRLQLVLASRGAGLPPPIDGVTADVQDESRLIEDCRRARRFGFGGKLCVHPRQVDTVNTTLSPTAQQMDWARRVLDAASNGHNGAFMFEGQMVDAPVLARARRFLAIN